MNRYEQLQEKYDDALFSLIMERVAEEEGKELLRENERLKADPNFKIPKSLDQKCLNTIRTGEQQPISPKTNPNEQERKNSCVQFRHLKHGILIAALIALLTLSAGAVFPELRSAVFNMFITQSDTYIGITWNNTGRYADKPHQHSENLLAGYSIPALPKEFVITASVETSTTSARKYAAGEDKFIYLIIGGTSDSSLHIGPESSRFSESILINEMPAQLFEGNGQWNLVWLDVAHNKVIQIWCAGIPKDQLLSFASEITYSAE